LIFAFDFELLYPSLQNVTLFLYFFFLVFTPLPFNSIHVLVTIVTTFHHFYTISFMNYDLFLFDFFYLLYFGIYARRKLAAPGTSKGGRPVAIIIILYCYEVKREPSHVSHLLYY